MIFWYQQTVIVLLYCYHRANRIKYSKCWILLTIKIVLMEVILYSEFDEVFVGTGARKVRNLFSKLFLVNIRSTCMMEEVITQYEYTYHRFNN